MKPHVPTALDKKLLGIYLNDHYAGAAAGRKRMANMAKMYKESPVGPQLRIIANQVDEETRSLEGLIRYLGISRSRHLVAAAAIGERLGRFKLNGRVIRASPLTPLVEAEFMRSAIVAKIGLWRTLMDLSPHLNLDPANFQNLQDQAATQLLTFDDMHAISRRTGFLQDGSPQPMSDS
ncbi:hypothetical protein [Pseudarthrobacter sp. PS3-L1]|uniref:hypothetical protein n=1 Tax=Pseudarthrobacter sp. PS3-L1 TaxID=3046207 RepID=UPI0024BBC3B0|nr:hypothetical protein [Pseudarthrobacter sp. PS3-L1]MDJ0318945.1 hypothetical protein [Pseudarthrobacter sp. PS3-L1]